MLDQCHHSSKGSKPEDPSLLAEVVTVLKQAWVLKWQLLGQLWSLALVPVGFVVFMVWNKGIVVGDRSAHKPVKHWMQPLYFALYTTAALAPMHWSLSRWADLTVMLSDSSMPKLYTCIP